MSDKHDVPARVARVRSNLLERSRAGAESTGAANIEVTPKALDDLHPDDVLERVSSILKAMPQDEVGDPAAFQDALEKLLRHGEAGLKKLIGPARSDAPPTPDQLASAEALIIADGTRPSFLLTEGSFKHDHPFLGTWHDDMVAFAPRLRSLSASIGRIQPLNGSAANFIGTGTLVDAGKGLVLTNHHVYAAARQRVEMRDNGDAIEVLGDLVIDFIGESGNPARNRWRIKEVRLPVGAATSFAGVDAAVMRIEPLDAQESKLPIQAITLSASPDYAEGASPTFVTVGYPGPPDVNSAPPGALIDWNFVIATLFNNRFGVKRAAPGRFLLPPGSVPEDHLGHVLSHDATTFGGASGSLLFAWKDDGGPAFGLHFAGATSTANYAVSLERAAKALRWAGLTLT